METNLAALAAAGALPLCEGPSAEEVEARLRLEPRVPTAFLTSAADAIVPAVGVRHSAAAMQAAHAGRRVEVSELDGAHCALHLSTSYLGCLEALLAPLDQSEGAWRR